MRFKSLLFSKSTLPKWTNGIDLERVGHDNSVWPGTKSSVSTMAIFVEFAIDGPFSKLINCIYTTYPDWNIIPINMVKRETSTNNQSSRLYKFSIKKQLNSKC